MLNPEATYENAVEKTVQYLRMRKISGSKKKKYPDAMDVDSLWNQESLELTNLPSFPF